MATYKIDNAHSSIGFSVKHMMIAKVHGVFEKFNGELTYDPSQPTQAKVVAEIQADSISTREAQRDAHLKSPDFFDVEKFPSLIFKSTSIQQNSDGSLKMQGDLTLHGVTQAVTFEVEGPSAELKDPWGNAKIGVSASAKIKRKDFGLNWNAALEAGGVLVGDEVTINLDLQFAKQS